MGKHSTETSPSRARRFFDTHRERLHELAAEVGDEASDVAWLRPRWANIADRAFGETDREYFAIARAHAAALESDAAFGTEDLLGPIGCHDHEPTHTLALAHLLAPTGPLGNAFANELFEAIAARKPDGGGDALDTARRHSAACEVVAERAEKLIAPSAHRASVRTDLWIELPARRPELIVVIENKINALEGTSQLPDYDRAIEVRVAQLSGTCDVWRVFLTPRGVNAGDHAAGWLALSYTDVAVALRRAMLAHKKSSVFAALYLATIAKRVLGLPSNDDTRSARAARLAYVGGVYRDR
jgi:hypothetical protein